MEEPATKTDDEFAVPVRTDTPKQEKTDEQVFDEVVEANDEPTDSAATPETSASVVAEESAHTTTAAQPAIPQAPVQPAAETTHKPAGSSPGVLVLQWVTYAFWGWFILAMLWLSALAFSYFISGNESVSWGDALAYPLASVIVMLLFALVSDLFYVRHEPEKKSGGSSVIMLIHAVLFVLLTVAALIVVVFSLINMTITSDPTNGTDGPMIALLTSLTAGVLYALASARLLLGGRKKVLRLVFWAVSALAALGFMIASIAGPAARANMTKDDRLIESSLQYLAQDIQSYARENDKLPAKLTDVKSTSGYAKDKVQLLISKKLVEYKPNSKPSTTNGQSSYYYDDSTSSSSSIKSPSTLNDYKLFYYQLCVDYKAEKNPDYYYKNTTNSSGDSYSTYVDTESHKKGNVCYDLEATGKYPDYGKVKPL